MSKLPVFKHFLSLGTSQAETRVNYQAETRAKIVSIESPPWPEEKRWATSAPAMIIPGGRLACEDSSSICELT